MRELLMWIPGTTSGLLADMQDAQLLMVAGFVMLGWVLVRRQLKQRKRVNRDARSANKAIKAVRERTEPSVPLCDAPPETQRWQVALFDLQRELKAELDTRIAVVQSLMRQLDDRIDRISQLERTGSMSASGNVNAWGDASPSRRRGFTPDKYLQISRLAKSGHSAKEIAGQTGVPLGDVELVIGTLEMNTSNHPSNKASDRSFG